MERSQSVDVCTVCHEHMEIFAIGICNHAICYRCSSRMRVLCDQMYCPICRGDLKQVAFVQDLMKFEKIKLNKFKQDKKHIFLENDAVEKAFKKLLSIQCTICPEGSTGDLPFNTLRDHLRKVHTLFFCDLCLKHLNIFPFERKFYNRKDLATHRRVGDIDDKSYKGHPLCVFCDERYMDNDELLRHLRKDHYYCHFCDADGTNDYYNDYPDLKAHFRDNHFLCEEEECGNAHTQFTNAFRTDIDLKAHKASQHTKGMSKAQIRDASRINIDIHLPPRRTGRDRGHITRRDYEEVSQGDRDKGKVGRGGYSAGGGRGGGGGGYRNRDRDNYVDDSKELEMAIEASKQDVPTGQKMSWGAEDIRQDFPMLSSNQEAAATVAASASNAASNVKSTASNQSTTNTTSKPVPSMASKISNSEKSVDNAQKAFPTLKKGVDKSGRNSPVAKDKKGSGRSSPVARVMQPVIASKKTKEEEFPDLSSSRNRNSNLISLGAWTQKNQRTDLVRPNIPMEEVEPKPTKNKKTKSDSNTLATLSADNDFPSLSGLRPAKNPVINKKSVWNEKKANQSKNTRAFVDDDFELPPSAVAPDVQNEDFVIKTESNVSKNKKKKKNKNKNDNSESNIENTTPVVPQEEAKKSKSKKKATEPPSSLDGIAVGLLKDEVSKANPSPKSGKKEKAGAKPEEKIPIEKEKKSQKEGKKEKAETKPEEKISIEKEKKSHKPEKAAPSDPLPIDTAVASAPRPLASLTDFPSLSSSTKAPPPGFQKSAKKPPPGFNSGSSGPSRPPPGFGTSDEKTVVTPDPVSAVPPLFSYVQPENFQTRNQQLVKLIRDCLDSQDKFDEFKRKSWQFRQNEIMPSEYYYSCEKLMGKEKFSEVFSELLVLLPDIKKQQDLLSVHNQSLKKLNNNIIKISGKSQKAHWATSSDFTVCPTCSQVTLKSDSTSHSANHVTNDFPALSIGKRSAGSDFMGRGSWVAAK